MSKRHVKGPARNTFGVTLRALRRSRYLTIAACANHLGISRSTWTEVELGNRVPFHLPQLRIISSLLSLSDDEMLKLRVAAATTNGYVPLEISGLSTEQRELAVEMVDCWSGLSRAQVRGIRDLLRRGGGS